MQYDVLKDCLLLWIEENDTGEAIKCRIKPGEICLNLVWSIKNYFYQIEQIPKEERSEHPISVTGKRALLKYYEAIQKPENFDLSGYGYTFNFQKERKNTD